MVRHPLRRNRNNNTAVKKRTWSAEEDQKLIAYIRRYGIGTGLTCPNLLMDKIAARLSGRTDNDIKNYWNTRLKKRIDNGNKLQIPTACDMKVKPNNDDSSSHPNASLPTIDTPKLEPSIVTQNEIPTMSANRFCTSYGVHHDDKTLENS
ncbi:hypothetical protein NL676_013341 [Syzygium grande]|nr:hypothetical protein NL676_013341 [Syzygium grande]